MIEGLLVMTAGGILMLIGVIFGAAIVTWAQDRVDKDKTSFTDDEDFSADNPVHVMVRSHFSDTGAMYSEAEEEIRRMIRSGIRFGYDPTIIEDRWGTKSND